MELFKTVPAYSRHLFIFANTKIYVKFDKFFRCIAHLGFNCSKLKKVGNQKFHML